MSHTAWHHAATVRSRLFPTSQCRVAQRYSSAYKWQGHVLRQVCFGLYNSSQEICRLEVTVQSWQIQEGLGFESQPWGFLKLSVYVLSMHLCFLCLPLRLKNMPVRLTGLSNLLYERILCLSVVLLWIGLLSRVYSTSYPGDRQQPQCNPANTSRLR